MFENLLHQNIIVSRLSRDISDGVIPPAMLFSGPAHSGKLTAALEVARVLSCEGDGDWRCPCSNCRSHRALAHSRTLLAGSRILTSEILAAAEVLRRDQGDAPRFLLVRSARKLLRRFDQILWEGDEKKLQKARPVMERLAESIDDFLPGGTLPKGKKFEKALKTLVEDCTALQKFLPSQLPVSQVRRITSWAVHSAGKDHKTVIFDGAERMPEGSRNALLKFLEEPPENTTVILITDRKSLLLPTIVSRLRDYGFKSRRPAEEGDVLRRVFREQPEDWGGLRDYFRSWSTGLSETMQEAAGAFIGAVRDESPQLPPEAASIKDVQELIAFLEALGDVEHRNWKKEDHPSHKAYSRRIAMIRDARMRSESLNIPVDQVLKSLFFSMRTL